MYLLECLQKTPPPVLIFCENKADVDEIHEYLLLKVRIEVKEGEEGGGRGVGNAVPLPQCGESWGGGVW